MQTTKTKRSHEGIYKEWEGTQNNNQRQKNKVWEGPQKEKHYSKNQVREEKKHINSLVKKTQGTSALCNRQSESEGEEQKQMQNESESSYRL